MSLEIDPNTQENNKIGMVMLYQADIIDYNRRIKQFKQNPRKSYTFVWEFCNKQIQKCIKKNVDYKTKTQDNPIKLLNYIEILMHEPERLNYSFAFKHVFNMKQKENRSLPRLLKTSETR